MQEAQQDGAGKRVPARGVVWLVLLVMGLNVLVWALANRPRTLPGWRQRVSGVAYSPFQRDQSPLEGRFPSTGELQADIQLLSRQARRLRTYSSTESPQIVALAAHYGMRVTAGAWIDTRRDHNHVELDALVKAAREYANIDAAIIGNEVLHRGDLGVRELTVLLDRARRRLDVPVSTAEPWHQWLRYPELAGHVDFITIHLLPYWERIPSRQALRHALAAYHKVKAAFPGKRIVIGEIGWPSQGDRLGDAVPSPSTQARFVREFLPVAAREGLEYYLMEAIDQPWKEVLEGRVGAYWGMYDANREPKYALTGAFVADPDWWFKALGASALAAVPLLWFGRRFQRFAVTGRVAFMLLMQGSLSLLVWLVCVPYDYYLDPVDWGMQIVLLPALLAIIAAALFSAFEVVEATSMVDWQRRFRVQPAPPGSVYPKVSIHLPCHNEPPEMVMLTLDSLARLDYPDFEVLVVDNNTASDEVWKPVEAHCALLGQRFRFFHLRPWPGFKAGALNFALEHTAADARLIAVVDSDYVVASNWLRDLVSHFEDPQVAVVQSPQAHRDHAHHAFRRMCSDEFDGFFRIGMHHRNERDAIIQHGTMTLIRAAALRTVGGWAEWCICEDAELGLKLIREGYSTRYVDTVMGRGLTPADFTAYKSQRFRWAFGAMQILRRHGRALLGLEPSRLTAGQRYHFLTGWFGWFADALHLMFTLLALGWSLGMLWNRDWFTLPLQVFLVPVLGFMLLKATAGILLYRRCVRSSWRDTFGAALASMALSHTIARGVFKGLVSHSHPFERTAKSRRLRRAPGWLRAIREETLLLIALLGTALAVALNLDAEQPETRLWIAVLVGQSLPYLSALVTAWIAHRAARHSQRAGLDALPLGVEAETTPAVCGETSHGVPTQKARHLGGP